MAGVTTNPTLLARAETTAEKLLPKLLSLFPGLIFHQPTGSSAGEIVEECRQVSTLAPDRLVMKVPCTFEGLRAGPLLAAHEVRFGYTAVFTPAQAYVAGEAGGQYVLPYLNRLSRTVGDGPSVISQMVAICRGAGRGVEIVVASVKSAEEAVAALSTGAQHVTAPLDVIEAMVTSPLTDAAMAEFGRAAKR